mmetsp:Transcript_47923/g.133599  ORF Transcript_47923/g.133599 Transcript_47923/m.133599 type:complete len:377 (+) Transcript_47923:65-1195(+)
MIFHIFIVICILYTINAQSSALGAIDVNIKISGTDFNIQFEPEVTSASLMAKKLCTENSERIGVTAANIVNSCIDPVTLYLNNVINEWALDKTLQVPVTLDNESFDVKFMPEVQSSETMALELCKAHAASAGLDEQSMPACVSPVTSYLQNAVNRWVAEKTLEVAVPIEGQTFQVTFLPERQSSRDMAIKLCRDNAQMLGVTEETFPACIDSVGNYLQNAVNRWVLSKTIEVPVKLGTATVPEKEFNLRFMPERVSAGEMARRLCIEQAAELGLTDTNIVAGCIAPVTDHVNGEIERWIQSKTLVVPVTFGNIPLEVSLLPEHDNVARVATNVCVQQANALGLTEETIRNDCIAPVAKYLQEEVQKWDAARLAVPA